MNNKINTFKEEIEKRVEKIQKLKTKIDTKYFLDTMKEKNLPNPYDVVRDFIMAKGLKLYGGQALHEHLEQFNAGIYEKYQLPDYDVFSPDAWNHAKELADLFHQMGYDYVEAKASIANDEKHQTYKVGVNFFFMLDVTQVGCPRAQYMKGTCGNCGADRNGKCIDIFNHIPVNDLNYYQDEKGDILEYKNVYDYKNDESLYPESFFVCSPDWLKTSMYYELSVPLADPSRTVKIATRLQKFNEFFEFNHDTCKPNKNFTINLTPLAKAVLKTCGEILKRQKVIHYGASAYNYFTKNIILDTAESLVDYEVYSHHAKQDVDEMVNKLNKLYKNKKNSSSFYVIERVQYWKGSDVTNYLIVATLPNTKPRVIVRYTQYTTCMPYIRHKGLRYATIDRIKYILYQSIMFKDILDAGQPKNYACILSHILKAEEDYLSKFKKPGKFRRFITKCEGEEINRIVENLKNFGDEKTKLLKNTTFILDYPKKGFTSKIYPSSSDKIMDVPYRPYELEEKKVKIPVHSLSKKTKKIKTRFITKQKTIRTPLFK
jgi:hypothetical protein